jgi:nucleoside-diphosphate-sugar epimerase
MTLVLVTGASGFIGGHIVEQLLLKGYKVRGTVQSIENTSSYDHLNGLINAENLEIVEASLLQEETSWMNISKDVEYVMHVASPFVLGPEDPEETLMMPGRKHFLCLLLFRFIVQSLNI